jgi:hypothetical protein
LAEIVKSNCFKTLEIKLRLPIIWGAIIQEKYYDTILCHKEQWQMFEGKWMQLENIMLSEVSHKSYMFFLICGR